MSGHFDLPGCHSFDNRLLELQARLRGGGDDVRHRRALPRRGADHAQEGDRQGAAEKAAVPHGTVRVEQSRRTLVHS